MHRDSTFDISYVFNEEFYKFYKKNGVEFKPMVIVMVMVMMVMLMVM